MSTMKNYNTKELKIWTREALKQGKHPDQIRKQIRKCIHKAKLSKKSEELMSLRLLLGDTYLDEGQRSKAAKRFSRILKDNPECVRAMIGLSRSYSSPEKARHWLEAAIHLASDMQDYNSQLAATNNLLFLEINRGGTDSINRVFDSMSQVLMNMDKLDNLVVDGVFCLLMQGKGELAISYLECLLKCILSQEYTLTDYVIVTRYLVESYRQSNVSEDDIANKLKSFQQNILNDSISKCYAYAIDYSVRTRWGSL